MECQKTYSSGSLDKKIKIGPKCNIFYSYEREIVYLKSRREVVQFSKVAGKGLQNLLF